MGEFERTKRLSVRKIPARQIACSSMVGATAQVEFGSVVGEGEFMASEQGLEGSTGQCELQGSVAPSPLDREDL